MIQAGFILKENSVMFFNNTGRQGGAISAYNSKLYLEGNDTSFVGNSADNGGAINLNEGAVMNLNADTCTTFKVNVADTYGGAIYVKEGAVINLNADSVTCIILKANIAGMYGGAIYVEDAEFFAKRPKCFLHINDPNGHYNVNFDKNTARISGADLFGGCRDT